MKTQKPLKKLALLLLLIAVIAGGIYYLYERNTFTFDTSSIENLNKSEFSYIDSVGEHLIFSISGTNSFGDTKDFEIQYHYNDQILNASSTNTFYDIMRPEDRESLINANLAMTYEVIDQDVSGEISVFSVLDNAKFKPLYIDTTQDIDFYLNQPIPVYTDKGELILEIPLTDKIKSSIESIYAGKIYDSISISSNIGRLIILNSYYDVNEDFDFFGALYKGGFKEKDANYVEILKNAVAALPFNIKKHALFSGLTIEGTDFSHVDQAFIAPYNEYYGLNYSTEDFKELTVGLYSRQDNIIYLNTNTLHHDYYVDYKRKKYTIDIDDHYSILKNNGSKTIELTSNAAILDYFEAQLTDTFYHELGHYIDRNSNYYNTITEDEMIQARPYYPYFYDKNFDNEHIAHAFSVYFQDKDYLKKYTPKMLNHLEKFVENLDFDEINLYDKFLNEYKNW